METETRLFIATLTSHFRFRVIRNNLLCMKRLGILHFIWRFSEMSQHPVTKFEWVMTYCECLLFQLTIKSWSRNNAVRILTSLRVWRPKNFRLTSGRGYIHHIQNALPCFVTHSASCSMDKVKIRFTLQQAMKAQRERSTGIVLLFL